MSLVLGVMLMASYLVVKEARTMVQAVQGFMTSDGRFYKEETEAWYHEAAGEMLKVLERSGMSEDVLDFLTSNATEIIPFLQAWIKFNGRGTQHNVSHKADVKVRRL